ncbi:MAG: response regulator transcription factor, partial [Gammaproteobacteria bacterium]|nr:response regulator transcription factor [Gammaproteobacteria bacterium]
NCNVTVAHSGAAGFSLAQSKHFDLIILDLMLPELDGLEICRRLRGQEHYTPILMLTAKTTELDRVLGLELGADDYLTKPFSVLELVARVKAIFRRMHALSSRDAAEPETIKVRDLIIDTGSRSVTLNGKSLTLTAKEFDLLAYFAGHPERVFSRSQLLDAVWGHGHGGYEHTVNSHINRLRAKIEVDTADPQYIVTVWGVGYKFSSSDRHAGG